MRASYLLIGSFVAAQSTSGRLFLAPTALSTEDRYRPLATGTDQAPSAFGETAFYPAFHRRHPADRKQSLRPVDLPLFFCAIGSASVALLATAGRRVSRRDVFKAALAAPLVLPSAAQAVVAARKPAVCDVSPGAPVCRTPAPPARTPERKPAGAKPIRSEARANPERRKTKPDERRPARKPAPTRPSTTRSTKTPTKRTERARPTRRTDTRKKPQQKITSKKPQKKITKRAPPRRRAKNGGGLPVLPALAALGLGALFLEDPEKEEKEITEKKPGRIRNLFSRFKKNDVDDDKAGVADTEPSAAQKDSPNPDEAQSTEPESA